MLCLLLHSLCLVAGHFQWIHLKPIHVAMHYIYMLLQHTNLNCQIHLHLWEGGEVYFNFGYNIKLVPFPWSLLYKLTKCCHDNVLPLILTCSIKNDLHQWIILTYPKFSILWHPTVSCSLHEMWWIREKLYESTTFSVDVWEFIDSFVFGVMQRDQTPIDTGPIKGCC